MARDGRDDERDEAARGDHRGPGPGVTDREPPAPAREIRQRVRDGRGQEYRVRGSEWQMLETVGSFRVVAERDLDGLGREAAVTRNDVRHLAESRLLERKTAVVNHQPTRLVVLTPAGKDLLDRHREERHGQAAQAYYAGFVKPRELAHDVQCYRAYRAERARLEADGGRVTRVVLDYELKRDYQTFLNRRDRPADATLETDREAFAEAQRLPIIDGHLELPDLRLEVELADGTRDVRDVEVVTEHYSHSQLAGKSQAGFALYRPARVSAFGRGGTTRGGTPHDPHTLEWLR
jgi:hypothetical protein